MLRNPLLLKVLTLVGLALLLLIPLDMIHSKISERQLLQIQVQQEIAKSASGPQTISGPYLLLRYKLTRLEVDADGKAHKNTSINEVSITPEQLKISGSADVETRQRGIYQARLFNLHSTFNGQFVIPQNYGLSHSSEEVQPVEAFLVMNISDSRGIRNVPQVLLNNEKFEFSPGSISNTAATNGIHIPLAAFDMKQSHTIQFSFPLELQGMSDLSVQPIGKQTEMNLQSSWLHPSFTGSYLPITREINEQGFKAHWLVSNLAKNQSNGSEVFSVEFIDPINIYLLSERAVKYGVLFVVLIFTGFALFEILRNLRIHPLQYLLVGLAMAVFFLLLISLSEHIAFITAYSLSASACSLLIGIYLLGVMKSFKPAFSFTAGLLLMYGVLYTVLQSEDNALLMGSLIIFCALACVMLLTRNMDWYQLSEPRVVRQQ